MISDTTIQCRVVKGVAWLDRHKRGWAHSIKLKTLVLESPSYCVLGQVFGDFWAALGQCQPKMTCPQQLTWAVRHGFADSEDSSSPACYYYRLGLAWRPYIIRRQKRHS